MTASSEDAVRAKYEACKKSFGQFTLSLGIAKVQKKKNLAEEIPCVNCPFYDKQKYIQTFTKVIPYQGTYRFSSPPRIKHHCQKHGYVETTGREFNA